MFPHFPIHRSYFTTTTFIPRDSVSTRFQKWILPDLLFGKLRPLGPNICGLVLTPFDEHTLQPPDDDDGQDDALVFVSLELAAQALGGFLDVAGEVVKLGFVKRKRHEKKGPLFLKSYREGVLAPTIDCLLPRVLSSATTVDPPNHRGRR